MLEIIPDTLKNAGKHISSNISCIHKRFHPLINPNDVECNFPPSVDGLKSVVDTLIFSL